MWQHERMMPVRGEHLEQLPKPRGEHDDLLLSVLDLRSRASRSSHQTCSRIRFLGKREGLARGGAIHLGDSIRNPLLRRLPLNLHFRLQRLSHSLGVIFERARRSRNEHTKTRQRFPGHRGRESQQARSRTARP